MAIFSLLLLSVYSAFRTGLLSHEKIDASTSLYQKARLSLSLIEAELKNTFVYAKTDSKFVGSSESMVFFSILDAYDKEGKIFPNIGYIRYKIFDNFLKRKAFKGMLALKVLQDSEDEDEFFLSDVKELTLQFAAPSVVTDKLYEWQNSWPRDGDPDQKKQLPLAVKIKLVLKQNDSGLVEFNKIIPIYVQ
jgi:type II secretory pathway component PulJ